MLKKNSRKLKGTEVKNKPRICFISLGVYSRFKRKPSKQAGGTETFFADLAKELILKGYSVAFITRGFDKNLPYDEGAYLYEWFAFNNYPKMLIWLLNQFALPYAMLKANADLYIYSNKSSNILSVALMSKILRSRFYFRLNSDICCKPYNSVSFFGEIIYRLGVTLSDEIIAQATNQAKLFIKYYKRKSVVIREGIFHEPQMQKVRYLVPTVIWVGSFSSTKRPELFVKLATALPKVNFIMVGGFGGGVGELSRDNKTLLENIKLPNLKITGFLDRTIVLKEYERCWLLVNTSDEEGFPKTFVEAWAAGLPVVSLEVDPDHIISRYSLGFHAGNFENLIKSVALLCNNGELRENISKKCEAFFSREFSIGLTAKNYERLFLSN